MRLGLEKGLWPSKGPGTSQSSIGLLSKKVRYLTMTVVLMVAQ
jgi:hypothetical protein